MHKIITAFLLAAVMLSGCGAPSVQSDVSSNASPSSSVIEQSNSTVSVDENLLTVDITLPASLFEEDGWLEDTDLDGFVAEKGLISAKKNPDGSVVIKMTKTKHKEMLSDMQSDMESNFAELIEAEFTPHVKSIEHTEGFKTVTVKVDRDGYENAFIEMTPFMVGFAGSMYQVFAGTEPRVEVTICDVADGSVIETAVYPDDFSN